MIVDAELFAWIGEDEFGSGEIGIKQGLTAVGLISLVSIDRSKVERLKPQIEAQAAQSGKKIRLIRFWPVEVLSETEAGE